MPKIMRRQLLQTSAELATPGLASAQSKQDKLVYIGDNGPWHCCLTEEVAFAATSKNGAPAEALGSCTPSSKPARCPAAAAMPETAGGSNATVMPPQWPRPTPHRRFVIVPAACSRMPSSTIQPSGANAMQRKAQGSTGCR